jgi:hypothetical protein
MTISASTNSKPLRVNTYSSAITHANARAWLRRALA